MKQIIYLLGLLLISGNAYSQLQYFLPRTDAYMSVTNVRYIFEGDTIINGLRYTKIFSQYGGSGDESDYTDPEYYAAVREDTVGGKIYCIQTNDGIERLLADFNVNPGDKVTIYSFDLYWGWEPYPREVEVEIESIDYIEISGEMRKRINIVDWYNDENWRDYWVEGIGSIHGLFTPAPEAIADATIPIFLCMYIEGELFWQNPKYDVCFLKSGGGGIAGVNQSRISIYPTPVKDILHIRGNEPDCRYRIYSMQGTPVLSGISGSELDLSDLKAGNYIIEFYDDKFRSIDKKKFIKI